MPGILQHQLWQDSCIVAQWMTQPRFIVPGETLLVTVRTLARFYLLRPDPELVQAIKYCLAHYAEKHSITLNAVCVMSTHLHLVVYDKLGHRSLFLRDVNRGIANVVKAMRGWRGPVFRPKPNIVRLLTNQAIVDKIAYVLANPVAAGAVKRAVEWPGLCEAAGMPGRQLVNVSRPSFFFSRTSELPLSTHFRLKLPEAVVAAFGSAETRRRISQAATRHEGRAQEEIRRLGWKVSGPQHWLSVSPYQRAEAYEAPGATEPTFAILGGGAELYIWAATQLRTFRRRYRAALEQWRTNKRRVRFRAGTWLMRVQHGVLCEARQETPPPRVLMCAS